MAKPKLGFIGLGIMGKPMSTNLLQAGYEVTVYNRSRGKVDEMVARGAKAASSSKEVAENADVVITIVTDTPDVKEVILGPNSVIEGAQQGMTVIDMTTMSPSVTREIAAALAEKGVDMLDAPVSGGDTGAQAGTLSIMVGGKSEVFERCKPILEVMGKNIVRVGDHGAGQTTKLCNQVVVCINNLAMCEALTLGAKAGLDLNQMLRAISGGAAGSWQLSNLGPRILKRDFAPGFMVRLQQKDLRLALEAGDELNLPLLGTSLVHQLFLAVQKLGGDDEGTQALVKALERLAGIEAKG